MTATHIRETELADLTLKNSVVVAYFWAPWCAPCTQFGPIYEAVSELHDDVVFTKINMDEAPNAPQQFNIKSIPTVVVFKNNEPVYNEAGAMNQLSFDMLIKMIKA
ncbi:thioredoxin family protein [Timonella sp. A28]|uniref:thioredoxin family protein n=1 Tax=Timonella sp. A28 TaxID=3442640 RepID=UPI003EBDA392